MTELSIWTPVEPANSKSMSVSTIPSVLVFFLTKWGHFLQEIQWKYYKKWMISDAFGLRFFSGCSRGFSKISFFTNIFELGLRVLINAFSEKNIFLLIILLSDCIKFYFLLSFYCFQIDEIRRIFDQVDDRLLYCAFKSIEVRLLVC